MKWLIWEKMFTYFYNKFRPVNYETLYYIKFVVNSSLLIILAAAYGLWHLGSLFIKTHSFHKGDILQIYFCVIFCETRHHTQAHITVPFGHGKNTNSRAAGLISLAIVCYVFFFSSSSSK